MYHDISGVELQSYMHWSVGIYFFHVGHLSICFILQPFEKSFFIIYTA